MIPEKKFNTNAKMSKIKVYFYYIKNKFTKCLINKFVSDLNMQDFIK